MADSNVEICNMALGMIGVSKAIANLETEQSNEAIQCRRFFSAMRNKALTDAPWNFATKHSTLQLTGTAPDGWDYSYRYPSDCLKIRRVYLEGSEESHPYQVGEDETNGGKLIFTDVQNALVVFTKRVENPRLFSPAFDLAFAAALGSMIAGPLSADAKKVADVRAFYQTAIRDAAASSANEGKEKKNVPEMEFVTARQ